MGRYVSGEAGGGVPQDSPALTGTPTAPTPPAGTSSEQLATTQFVQQRTGAVDTNLELRSSRYRQAPNITVAGGGTATVDYNLGDLVRVTATGNFTLAITNMPTSMLSGLIIEAVGWGGRTITFPGGSRFGGGGNTFLSSLTPSGTDIIAVIRDASGVFHFNNVIKDART